MTKIMNDFYKYEILLIKIKMKIKSFLKKKSTHTKKMCVWIFFLNI